jgi:hypothetical protein
MSAPEVSSVFEAGFLSTVAMGSRGLGDGAGGANWRFAPWTANRTAGFDGERTGFLAVNPFMVSGLGRSGKESRAARGGPVAGVAGFCGL